MNLPFEEAQSWANDIVAQMTLAEKCDYIGGTEGFFTKALQRLGITQVMMSDATAGVNLRYRLGEDTYQNALEKSTAFPCPVQLAATWNLPLVTQYANSVAEECLANGIGILLGPGFNLYRHSQCGRNFEYFGEDPFLISRLVENYVTAVQQRGVIATLKHFVANNSDYFRRKSNSIVSERALHEIYLPGFKAGVEAGALAVMTSYNLLNGEWAGQSDYVIKNLLRKQLGFKGLVMTDWWSVYDGAKVVASGQDLEMPANLATLGLVDKVSAGEINEADVDQMVHHILTVLKTMALFDLKPHPECTHEESWAKRRNIALQTAREGTVLLRNEGILPLKGDGEILVIGDFVDEKLLGGGAAEVKGYDTVQLIDALRQELGPRVRYEKGPSWEHIQNAEHVILSIGTRDGEGYDRPFALSHFDEAFVRRVTRSNANVIVLVQSGSGIRMTDWYADTKAIVYCWYNGQNGHQAVAEILSGKVNPSGKLPMTIERDFADGVDPHYVPKGECLYGGFNDDWEAIRQVFDITYDEGVFVGYRWYDSKGIEPLFPFGHGLSYTQFDYDALQVSKASFSADETVEISASIKNSGERSGAEIVQLYVGDLSNNGERPPKELKGFQKIDLQPGKSGVVSFSLDRSAFSYWCPKQGDWVAKPGEFALLVAASSRDIRLKATVTLV